MLNGDDGTDNGSFFRLSPIRPEKESKPSIPRRHNTLRNPALFMGGSFFEFATSNIESLICSKRPRKWKVACPPSPSSSNLASIPREMDSGARRTRISDYALIGNCRTAALVSSQGSIDWCCFPKFDSPSTFARILDAGAGHFSLTPIGPFETSQGYLEHTNVLQTRFTTPTGRTTLTDCFTVREEGTAPDRLRPDEEILRIIEVEEGEVELRVDFHPRARYGRSPLSLKRMGDWGICGGEGRKQFLLQSTVGGALLSFDDNRQRAQGNIPLRKGERAIFSLTYSDEAPAVMPPLDTAQERLRLTIEYWRNWSARNRYRGPSQALIERSALTLKLLNFAPSGAFVAAPTTSLPEWIGGSRNWDYRFCWLRDASFTTRALLQLGYLDEAKAFLNWLLHSTRLTWPRLQVVYTIYGEPNLPEIIAHWLSGFLDSRPVRIGNAASRQTQLDVYGEVIDSFFALSPHLELIDQETRKMVIGFGRAVAELWDRPDQGIWEFRRAPMHYTHTKLMCWVAMDRMKQLALRLDWRLPYDAETIADRIRVEIESKGYDFRQGTYTRAFGETELDSSLLVMPLVGYCEANEPRYAATREAIVTRLSKNDLVHRYPLISDNIEDPEGAFTLCNFWLAESFALSGSLPEATKWFEAVVRSLPQTGLSAEELDPDTRESLGNYPQGFSHIGLIHAALAIDRLRNDQSGRRKKAA